MNSTDTSLFFFNDWTANQDGIFSKNLSLSQAWNRALLKILKAKITQCVGLWPKTQGFFLKKFKVMRPNPKPGGIECKPWSYNLLIKVANLQLANECNLFSYSFSRKNQETLPKTQGILPKTFQIWSKNSRIWKILKDMRPCWAYWASKKCTKNKPVLELLNYVCECRCN